MLPGGAPTAVPVVRPVIADCASSSLFWRTEVTTSVMALIELESSLISLPRLSPPSSRRGTTTHSQLLQVLLREPQSPPVTFVPQAIQQPQLPPRMQEFHTAVAAP